MRMYWQPAALVDELQGRARSRPVKLLGEDLVLFRDEQGRYGLIDRHCAHRGADLAFGRLENGGLRCAFHGWLFDVVGPMPGDAGRAEGLASCARTSGSAPIPWSRRAASSGPISAKASRRRFRSSTASSRPTAYTFAFKGHFDCNWLQALEVGIDPAHASFLHRFFEDEDTVGRLRQAVPRRVGRQRHADDQDPARIRPARSSMSSTPNTACG